MLRTCICAQNPTIRIGLSEIINCKNKGCLNKLHFSCMKVLLNDEESIQQFECPSCILKKYDPLHHVIDTLLDAQVI